MSLRINTNVQALFGHRMMQKNDSAMSKSLEKLSSGLKINRASDNPAGLIISEQLRAQIGGLEQAQSNTEQAIAMVQTAEGALDEMNSMLSKAKKLALSSMSSATTDSTQATANNTEYLNLVQSIQRIAKNTQYAGTNLLDGSLSDGKTVQLGAFVGQNTTISITALSANSIGLLSTDGSSLTFDVATAGGASQVLSLVEAAITQVSTRRGTLGAVQANSLETTLNSLRASYENLQAAQSTVRDVDFAAESATFTRNQILVQSATAMLAQANQLPQGVLKLLG